MKKFLLCTSIMLVLIAGSSGCSTTKQSFLYSGVVRVAVDESGFAQIDRESFHISKLAEKIKEMGAGPAISVVISVPKKTTNRELASITRQLRKAGFSKIVFTKPSHVETSADPVPDQQAGQK